MPGTVELTWHPSGATKRGSVIVRMRMLFLQGNKEESLKNLSSAPEPAQNGLVHLRFGEKSCDIQFVQQDAADDFVAQLRQDFEAANNPNKRQARPLDLPSKPEKPVQTPAVRRARPPPEDFETLSVGNNLRRPATAASANDDREARKRHIDSHTTSVATPEKSCRTSYHLGMRRAPPPRSSLVDVSTRKPAAPQGSSSYGGYRSSVTFGLRNLGNTCYLNAVMQACRSLRELVGDLQATAKLLPPCKDGALYKHTMGTLEQMGAAGNTTGPVSPTKVREQVGLAAPMFATNQQQDAHEFFLEFVNQLHDEMLAGRNHWLSRQEADAGAGPQEDAAPLATQLHFDSEVQKRLVCVQCQSEREVVERFRDFSLDFYKPPEDGSDRCSLTGMLRTYFDRELLEVKCEKCGAVAAHMEKHLTAPPRVLVLHLKRFTPNLEKQRYDKQHQHVDIPSTLDLNAVLGSSAAVGPGFSPPRLPARPLAAEADAPAAPETPVLQYNLRAVVAHDGGSPHSGHYTCYAHGEDGTWRLYDDSIVRDIPAGQELHRTLGRLSYIVFYVLQMPDGKA